MKKYLSLIGFSILILIVFRLGYQSFYSYLGEHLYYINMLSSSQNRGIFFSAFIFTLIPIIYTIGFNKFSLKTLILIIGICAGIFGAVHSGIKLGSTNMPAGIGYLIVIFHTLLLFSLGVYLICGFSAIGSRIERKFIKFKQINWQEIFLCFGLGFISFTIIIQILLGIGLLYGIISWLLFLGLGFMIRYERKNLGIWIKKLEVIINKFIDGIKNCERNLNSKRFRQSKNFGYFAYLFLIIISLGYVFIGIQNAFTPYSTAWDANHEYMYTPKILAENHGVFRGNSVGSSMPGTWHQFLTFIFSLTSCTEGRLGLSPDNIAISMNNISAFFVLIFGIAIIFEIFTIIGNKKEKDEKILESGKGKNQTSIGNNNLENSEGIFMGRATLLLRLTSGMGAFIVIVDNKTDLGVMALSLLAFLSGLIFLQMKRNGEEKKELLKYIIITGTLFGFAALAKISALTDFVLFGLLAVGLLFSPIITLGLGIAAIGVVGKKKELYSSLMVTDTNTTRFIIIGLIITIIGVIIYALMHLRKADKRKIFKRDFSQLLILCICYLIPFLIFKLPRTTISLVEGHRFSVKNVIDYTFFAKNTNNKNLERKNLLAQNDLPYNSNSDEITDEYNIDINNGYVDIKTQDEIDNIILNDKDNNIDYSQCAAIGNIYSKDELNEGLQEIIGSGGKEDLLRYIGFGWVQFNAEDTVTFNEGSTGSRNLFSSMKTFWPQNNHCNDMSKDEKIECEKLIKENGIVYKKNLLFGVMKTLWPTSETCYGFNHDAKVLCNNASTIDNFKIDDLRSIYENKINNKNGEAGLLLKTAIDAYDKAKSEGRIGFGTNNVDTFHDEIVNLRQYYQSHSIYSTSGSIYIPYRYLVPLTITFNRSIQNPSSYYTDIGFPRVIIYILIIISLPYAIFKKDKVLINVSLTTRIGWAIRRVIGSAILWYGIVLIYRSIITVTLFMNQLFKKDNKDTTPKILPQILLFLIGFFFLIQIIFNFMRINSQGANGVFVRYKGNVGNEQKITVKDDGSYDVVNKIKYNYGRKNVFNLQFPQYNPIIHALADRKDEEGVIVAGTYILYFLGNQWNISYDGTLDGFRKTTSDGDLCKTYRRLKNGNTRYLIIDPNIGTVTMGEGNESLFYRFFGKLNDNDTKIEIDGTIITLIKLAKAGYLELLSTNNLGARYAFIVDDNTLKEFLGKDLTDEELIIKRGKMAVLQYFGDNDIFGAIMNIFVSRIMNDTKGGLEDIASIYGYEIDSEELSNTVKEIIGNRINVKEKQKIINNLPEDEKSVVVGYLNIYTTYQSNPRNLQSTIQSLLTSSIGGPSQIIGLKLK